jgi:radical SAM superfamily enzyme YgiQ (UPF0313 family)
MTRPKETGAIYKPAGAQLPVALVYPNTYRVGMGNLGFQTVYAYLNSFPEIAAERFFLPDERRERGKSAQVPRSEESGRPISEFRLIAFSVPFENDYPQVPGMLLSAGIPPLQEERGPSDPLVIAGGVSVSMNPEPLAPFLDLAFLGEIEGLSQAEDHFFSALVTELYAGSRRMADRQGLLRALRDVPGVYVPSAYTYRFDSAGVLQSIEPEDGFPDRITALKRRGREEEVPLSVLFAPQAEFGDSLLVEANRGCGRGCRFCAAGWIHMPVRHAQFERFRAGVDNAMESGRTVGLIGSDLAGHPQLEEILSYVIDHGGTFSLSSIRPEGLSPRVIELVAATGQKTATLAPEVASPRLKKVIGKEIPSERFCELVEMLVAAGIGNVRFYFMIGLPTETDEDAQAIVEFVSEARKVFVQASRLTKRIGRISVQVNPFVPKPWTPFQWAGMTPPAILERRVKVIREGLKHQPNVVLRVESIKEALAQAVLSRGDRRLARALLRAAGQEARWQTIFKKEGLDPAFYALRERGQHELLPWDVTDHGVPKQALWRIYSKAMHQHD